MIQRIQRLSKEKKAFTLIELMIVVAIIAILAALALPQYNKYRQKAEAKEMLTGARACAMEIVSECMANGGQNPNLNDTDASAYESCRNYNSPKIGNVDIVLNPSNNCSQFHVNADDKAGTNPFYAKCNGNYQNGVECWLK